MKGIWLHDTFLRELLSHKAKTIIVCQWDARIQSMKAGASELHFEEQKHLVGFPIGFVVVPSFQDLQVRCSIFKKLLYVLTSTGFLIQMPLVREGSSTS